MRTLPVVLVAAASGLPASAATFLSSNDGAAAGLGIMVILVLFALGLAFYFLPTIVVTARKVDSAGGIIALNILLGWTAIGWVVALVWAFSKETRSQAALREMAYRNMASQSPSIYPPQGAPR